MVAVQRPLVQLVHQISGRLLHSEPARCQPMPAENKEELVKQLGRREQDTKTRGKRVTEAARVAGEGMSQAWCT